MKRSNKSPLDFFNTFSGKVVNVPPTFLSCFYSAVNQPSLLIVDDEAYALLHEHSHLNWPEHGVFWVPQQPSQASSPVGFQDTYQRDVVLLSSLMVVGFEGVSMVVCPRSMAGFSVVTPKLEPFIVDSGVEYDSLIGLLGELGFDSVDVVVSKNQFSVRGAVVDFYPDSSRNPIRASFFGEMMELFYFDLNSQLVAEGVESIKIPLKDDGEGSVSLQDYILSLGIFNVVEYLGGGDLVSGDDQPLGSFPYKSISFDEYVQGFVNNRVVPCDFGGFHGFVGDDGVCFVPHWFIQSGGSQKDTSQAQNYGFQYEDLSVGDYVVHQDCGVGRFRGLKTTYDDNDNIDEALVIEYADGGLVSLDVNHLHKLSFYSKADEGVVHIDSLNKRGLWDKKKRKARKQADEVVGSLLSAYVLRKNITRPPLSVDKQLETLFLNQFPFEETVDQNRVWNEISSDLSSSTPMDRLLCGDVGFGKTEVAIRVAFRAALHGKKVLVLSPTTILSKQLEVAFYERLNAFGIIVTSVSRFKTKKEVDSIKSRWAEGKIDVLVGTHTVLYDKIYLSRVGLLIVDEEHRFGVNQKESIRSLKHTIDVLSMSATPIPRTLNLALSGIRDISTLTTPPLSRRPIETQVSFFNEDLIKKVILVEKQRGGQIFFVHNDVKTLPNYQRFLSKALPNLSIGVVHGQLPTKQIEDIMQSFLEKGVDILLCTSIIETGIDVANANTVIVNNAHNFGLSQLYQIRGRVGRSSSQAFAYLLIPEGKSLKRDAFRRLKAIEENTHLGAGYNISNMDLEIRGAGAVFGYKQSGGVGSVGFELYSVYIKEALTKLNKQEVLLSPQDVVVKIFNSAIIPEEYLPSTNLRIQFYRRINSVESLESLGLIKKEIENRVGPIPLLLENLFNVWKVKCLGAITGVQSIEKNGTLLSVVFEKTFVEPRLDSIFKLLPDFSAMTGWEYQFKPKLDNGFVVVFRINNGDISSTMITFLNKLDTVFKS